MLFPRGEVRHQNLLTAYTDFSALITTLKSEGFSGTVEVEFPGNKGVLFIASGEIINAEANRGSDPRRLLGQEAARHLLSLSNQKDGILQVYRMDPDRVAAVTGTLESEILYKDLSSDFTRLDRLVLKLKEEKHTGFIEILTKDQNPAGVLFLQDGEIADLFTATESGASVVEKKTAPVFLENAVKQGAIFNVYRSNGKMTSKPTPAKGTGTKDLIPILQDVLSRVEKLVDILVLRGAFRKGFRKALIEKSADYPFLDPFAGEFEYRDGSVVFTGDAELKDFARGIGECLQTAVSNLEHEFPKKKLVPVKVKAEIESCLEHHREEMKRLGVDTFFSSFY